MGSGSWSNEAYQTYSQTHQVQTRSVEQIFSKRLHRDLDPRHITVREARDNAEHPNSTPIILGLDVTGSMNPVLSEVIKHGLNKLVTEIYNRKPVVDPQICCMGVGDLDAGDEAPLQVTQFESDIRIADQLTKIWPEGGGGGNDHESYSLPWYFAQNFVQTDAWDKRKQKGFIFTFGDELPNPSLPRESFDRVFGKSPTRGAHLNTKDLLDQVSEKYHVFHLLVAEGSYMQRHSAEVKKQWSELLGQRAILLPKIDKLAQVIVSTMQMVGGASFDQVKAGWDGDTSAFLNSIHEFGRIVELS